MFFSLSELEHHPIHFDVAYNPGEIALSDELRQSGPLRAAGQAELLPHTGGEIRLQGRVEAVLEADCDRCLELARFPLEESFDLFYRPALNTANHAEIRLKEGEIEVSFYQGDGLSLEESLREVLLLSLPMHRICREDCRGLCPVCGGNRNQADCACQAKAADPRWEALKNL
jgi:uncharacterized protein